MNILRWKRKSKKKIKLKSIVLVIFSLIMTTFAWFAYSKVLEPTLNLHIASWDMEYYIGEVEKTNPIGVEIPVLYPAMDEQSIKIDIKNNGERTVDIEYQVQSLTICGVSYEIVQEGGTPTSSNYVIVTPSSYETDATTGKEIAKGAITNELTTFPFTILIEHSAQVTRASQGYLTITVNWIGDQNELDSEWGYIVGDYFINNPTATSAMSIVLSIDSYQAEDNAEAIEQTLPSTALTAPYLLEGFTRVPGTTLEKGLVVEDASGNEFVWVEVPKSTDVYGEENMNLDIDNLTGDALTAAYNTIETKLKEYAGDYNTVPDIYTSYGATGISSESAYTELKQKMLKSIYKYGGFYIGRYETGIAYDDAAGMRTSYSSSTPSQTPVIKQNTYPFNFVDGKQAQQLAEGMATEAYTTSLLFGIQWDLALRYLDTKGAATSDELMVDSTTWGNYINNEFDVINPNAKYSLTGNTWLTSPYSKPIDTSIAITTGGSNLLFKQNIYDLAGNLSEWTLNYQYDDNGDPAGGNGGNYDLEGGAGSANSRAAYKASRGQKYIGFRVAMYVEDGPTEAVGGSGIGEGSGSGSGSGSDSGAETNPYIPTGFSWVTGTDLSTGYTIQDGSLNQYVWVEVPRNATVYDEIGTDLDLDSLSGDALTTAYSDIETELQEYATDYRKSGYSDTWSSAEATGIASADDYNALKQTMLKSVYENGGFYIGKYETGTATARTAETDALTTAVVQANAYPYNYVTNAQAQSLASGMSSGEYTSSLMFGIQWDLVMKYLESKGATQEELSGSTTGSTNWGNYYDSTYNITNASSKYYTDDAGSWTDSAYGEKASGTSVLLSTGADSQFSKMGIYDLAGNVYEWTLEYTSNSSNPCTSRGGSYINNGDVNPASDRNNFGTTTAFYLFGFRVALY